MVHFTSAESDQDIEGILSLQQKNLSTVIDPEELKKEGFVTVAHNFDLLKRMNSPFPHAIAKDGERVVGYALVMLPAIQEHVPVLMPLFKQLDSLHFRDRLMKDIPYFVMGQVCIDKAHRGQGVFPGLYHQLRSQMQEHFELILTSVATRNPRSLRAHEKVGFTIISQFTDETDEWKVVCWDWDTL